MTKSLDSIVHTIGFDRPVVVIPSPSNTGSEEEDESIPRRTQMDMTAHHISETARKMGNLNLCDAVVTATAKCMYDEKWSD